jgi:phospholipid/cholesterol/gamma-HCH transport system ATP-binding protein
MSIRFASVSKSFGPKKILDQVSFTVETAEILFILGRSGMGKSVTLKHMIGLLKPDSGAVEVDGTRVDQADAEELQAVRRRCGMVFQQPALLDSLTVFENVSFGLDESLSLEKKREICASTLELVQLNEDVLDRYPAEISYGMQKRVSLARTLAPGPSYLLFDEPTTGLDPVTTRAVNELIQELSRKLQVTSIVVSHDMNCALGIADRILVLDQARILALGTPAEIRRSPAPLIRDFLAEVDSP